MSDQTLTYTGTITKTGEIRLPKRMRSEMVTAFRSDRENRTIEVAVRRKRRRRSSPQNRYYWGVLINTLYQYFNDWSPGTWTRETIHQYVKERFLPMVWEEDRPEMVVPETGEVLTPPYTTTKLSRTQFATYVDLISSWAWESLDVTIEAPGEPWVNTAQDINKAAY